MIHCRIRITIVILWDSAGKLISLPNLVVSRVLIPKIYGIIFFGQDFTRHFNFQNGRHVNLWLGQYLNNASNKIVYYRIFWNILWYVFIPYSIYVKLKKIWHPIELYFQDGIQDGRHKYWNGHNSVTSWPNMTILMSITRFRGSKNALKLPKVILEYHKSNILNTCTNLYCVISAIQHYSVLC